MALEIVPERLRRHVTESQIHYTANRLDLLRLSGD